MSEDVEIKSLKGISERSFFLNLLNLTETLEGILSYDLEGS